MAAILLAGSPVNAQAIGGFALDRYNPAERGSDWFVVDSLDFRGKARPSFGVTGDFARKPLTINDDSGNELLVVVDNQAVVHASLGLVLADRLRLGVSMPFVVYQKGSDGTAAPTSFLGPPNAQAIGDLRLGLDIRLGGRYLGPFTAAIGGQVFVPTGDQKNYASDGQVRANGHLLFAGDAGALAYGLRFAFDYRKLENSIDGRIFGSEVSAAAGLGIRAANRHVLIGVEAFGSTVVSNSDATFKRATTPVELLLGLHFDFGGFRLNLGGGPGLTHAIGTPVFRGLVSLEFVPTFEEAPGDRDGDGIPDREDACPDQRGVRSTDPKMNGCPAPTVAEPQAPPPDRDGDGVMDVDDACPDVPGIRTDDRKTSGCPSDKDGDGVPDIEDACPDVAGVRTGNARDNGCPADTDHDGIPDTQDACPNEAGPTNPDPKKNGCPEVRVEKGQIIITQQVKFKTGSDVILPESDGILQAVAQVFREHPEILRVEIQGHTDSTGKKAVNQKLSQRRAQSVVNWLIKNSVEARRLVAKGYGQDLPIDTNATAAGRQNNRRVEFHILEPPQK